MDRGLGGIVLSPLFTYMASLSILPNMQMDCTMAAGGMFGWIREYNSKLQTPTDDYYRNPFIAGRDVRSA